MNPDWIISVFILEISSLVFFQWRKRPTKAKVMRTQERHNGIQGWEEGEREKERRTE